MAFDAPLGNKSVAADRQRGLIAQILLGLPGPFFMVALVLQYLDVYFTVGGSTPPPTPADGERYLWTAGLANLFAVAGVVLALVRRRGIAFLAAGFLLIGVLGLSVIAAVPQGRWYPHPGSAPLPSDYQPCFSGSNTCPGG
jgi:hypothetical protein